MPTVLMQKAPFPVANKNLGWGFGKLEVMTELPRRQFLFVVSDTVFAGHVIEHLSSSTRISSSKIEITPRPGDEEAARHIQVSDCTPKESIIR